MSSKRVIFKRRVISGFRWFGAFLLGVYLYWWVMTNFVIRDFWDPAFAMKTEIMRERMKQYPGHPLWAVIGSSRVDFGFHPGVVAGRLKEKADAPLVFNLGFGAEDLFREYICLRRLVEDGTKPQRVGIEILAPLLQRPYEPFADLPNLAVRARWDEIDDLCTYAADPASTRGGWRQSRFNPFYEHGLVSPRQTLAVRLAPIPGIRKLENRFYDDWGWFPVPPAPIPQAVYDAQFNETKGQYEPYFKGPFAIFTAADRSLRRILDLCRTSGIEVVLFRMPEGTDFQAIYTPQANAVIDDYLRKIETEYGVAMIDARSWMPEKENFADGHHLNATGGEKFTRRFIDELEKTKATIPRAVASAPPAGKMELAGQIPAGGSVH